jgi:gliding motility-associated-like protein
LIIFSIFFNIFEKRISPGIPAIGCFIANTLLLVNTLSMKRILFLFFILLCGANTFAQVPSYVNTAGLLAWYPFNSNVNNAWSGTDNGVIYGGVSYGTDRFGSAASCYIGDGSSGVDIPVNDFPLGNNPRSMSFWYKSVLPFPGGDREVMAWGDNSTPGARFGASIHASSIGFESVGVGEMHTITYDSVWHHVAITYPVGGTGLSSIKIYFDGVIASSTPIGALGVLNTVSGTIHSIGTLFIPGFTYSWDGSLDDIGVWSREISPCEVSYLYGNHVPTFAGGRSENLIICENAFASSLDALLAVNDADVGQNETWSVYTLPTHGTVIGSYVTTSTGFTLTPSGLSYTPTAGYVGTDAFKIIITDCGGAADTVTVNVLINPLPTVGPIGGPKVVCTGSSITLSDATFGGIWSTSNASASVAGGVVTGISAGIDTVFYSVTTACGTATASQSITINPVPPAPLIAGTTTYCQNDTYVPPAVTGTGVLWYTAPTGGIGSVTAPTINTAIPGTYIIYATQTITGCESPRTPFTIIVRPTPALPVITATPSNYCPGQKFVPFYVFSGSNILWYNVATGGVGSNIAPTINTSIPGSYTVYASQTIFGCESGRLAITVTVGDSVKAGFIPIIKYGCKADTVMFNNTSKNTTDYIWWFGDLHVSTLTNPTHVFVLQAIDTVKLIASEGGCIDSSIQYIDLRHPLKAAFTVDTDLICQGGMVTFSDSSVFAPGATVFYLWSFGDGYTDNTSVITRTHTYHQAGVLNSYLVLSDTLHCTDTMFKKIKVDTISGIQVAITDTTICKGTYITLTGYYASIGNTGVTWNFGNGDSVKNQNPIVYGYDQTGVFTITATADYRICPEPSLTRKVTVVAQPIINLGPDTAICAGGESVLLKDNINAGNARATWVWSNGATTAGISVVAPGVYTATVMVGGCTSSSTVNVSNDCYMNIPNAFTPNNDGVNDYFYPRQYLSKGLISFALNIYNRWGELIFQTNALEGSGWDGKFNNVDQPEGVYIYVIDGVFKDGQHEHHQGNVTLLR